MLLREIKFSLNCLQFCCIFLQELKKGYRIFEDFVDDGLIEYLDVNEMNDASIAVYENQIKLNTTHLEVQASFFFDCSQIFEYPLAQNVVK